MPLGHGKNAACLGIVGQVGLGDPLAFFLHLGEHVADFIRRVIADVKDLSLQILVGTRHFQDFDAAEKHLRGLPKGMAEAGERLHHHL